MKLYDNAFSPFARKVRMVLDHKGLDYETIDGLDLDNHAALTAVNGRIEVPTLEDDGVTVVNSADIVAYLEHRHPANPVYPEDPARRVAARAWERCADSTIDPILVDISYWLWAERPDAMPAGLKEAAQADMNQVYAALEHALSEEDFVCGALSVADIALFPHLSAVRAMGVPFDPADQPKLAAWLKRMLSLDICKADVTRARNYINSIADRNLERRRIFWRGDRIEWLLARGYHDWFAKEIAEDRVIWPGLGIPDPEA